MTTKRYSEEFKQSMISLKHSGRSATSLSKEYHVSVSTICKWIQQDNPSNTNVLAASVIDPSKIKQLETKIIHSDMRSQYTSELFEETLNQLNLKHSYSRKGGPGDNARIESFHSILKREYINFQCFQSLEEAILGIDTYIRWYNKD
ncbi:integrase core domain-containing protein [Vagococcus jeotgali]|uniref:integrase core domain-containing protein n=1 Tax=Vagococcus jeotgali TaxID=3109030 RepID=UPI00351D6A89